MAGKGGYSILLVEDDLELQASMLEHLARAGYDVHAAVNGWEARKSLKSGVTALVVAEYGLADTDGSSLREWCLLNPGMRDVPFLYLIGDKESERQIRGLRSGVDDWMMKPFDPVMLVVRVQSAIERRRVYDEMVRVDPLTRLLNRPTFEREIIEELERVRRYNRFASMALLDLDDLSQVNASEGQAMGDLLLTCLSGIILNNMRNVDKAGRHGAEQFVIYLPETREAGAYTLVDRIQSRFEKVSDAMTGLSISFSAGLLETPRDSTDLETLLTRAEEAVHLARQEGVSRLVLWAKELGTPGAARERRAHRDDLDRPFDC